MDKLEFHPFSEAFPLLEGAEFDALVESIRKNGQREVIVLLGKKILDGRNRYRACEQIGLEPRTREFTGTDPVAFVVDANIRRRHLNDDQRARVAAKITTMTVGRPKTPEDSKPDISPNGEISQTRAAKLLNVSKRSVERASKVQKKGLPELQMAVEKGEVSLTKAADIANLPKNKQVGAIERARPKPKAALKKNAEVVHLSEHRNRMDETCEKIARAIIDINSYRQSATDVARHLRTLDVSCLVDEKLDNVVTWINQFAQAWQEATNARSA